MKLPQRKLDIDGRRFYFQLNENCTHYAFEKGADKERVLAAMHARACGERAGWCRC